MPSATTLSLGHFYVVMPNTVVLITGVHSHLGALTRQTFYLSMNHGAGAVRAVQARRQRVLPAHRRAVSDSCQVRVPALELVFIPARSFSKLILLVIRVWMHPYLPRARLSQADHHGIG